MKKTVLSISMLMTFLLTSCGTPVKEVDSVSESSSDTIYTDNEHSENADNEHSETIVLTMAMTGDSSGIEQAVREFNSEDNGYCIEIKQYSDQISDEEITYEERIKKYQ